jgi:hypothetical protein
MAKKRIQPEKGLSDRQLIEKYDSPEIERFNQGLDAMINTELPRHTEHKKGKHGKSSLPPLGELPPLK